MNKNIIFWNIKTEPDQGKFQFEEGIGAHKLSTIAKRQGYNTVIYQDHQFRASPEKIKEVTERSLSEGENIIAYSLLSNGLPLLKELVNNDTAAGVPVILGGPGATIEPEKVLGLYDGKDIPLALVQGDGESAFTRLMQKKPEEWHQLEGIWSRSNDRIKEGTFFAGEDLDRSPFADLYASAQRKKTEEDVHDSSLPLEKKVEFLKSLMISQIESGRGCYYNCEFCSTSSLQISRIRKSSPQRLVREMEYMFNEHGITFFSITDNVAFDRAEWWQEFAGLMENSKITPYIQFGGYSAPKFINKNRWREVIPQLYSVGLQGIILGVQAGARRVLREIVHRAPDDPENALAAAQNLVPLGVNLKVDFIIGHPTETMEELKITHQWIKRIYQSGGEVFVRRLGVVPHSGYFHKLAAGKYTLPEETPEYLSKVEEILSMKAKDDRYKDIAFSGGKVPNKYLIDRKKGIIYPSTVFDVDVLKENAARLGNSPMPDHVKERYGLMFEMVIKLKEEKDYEF